MPEEWYDGAYFNRKFMFRFGDCDRAKNASLYAITKLVSELAGEDYERRGLGYDCLSERGQALLLSKMRFKFERMPVHTEEIVASTWERFDKGPFFYRDFELKSIDDEVLVSGASQWMLVDIISRKVLRPSSLAEGRRQTDLRKSDCPDCEKLSKTGDLSVLGIRPIYISDLDANNHVNNAVYGKIANDYLPVEIRQKEIKGFLINYFLEVKQGELLEISGAFTDTGYIIQGTANNSLRFGCEYFC
ncbi:MAG: hypothetical protein KBI01_01640 [Oscillospiraceae bacterium]|nr:hypothetical protein [Oscillospiraceae bacterium]